MKHMLLLTFAALLLAGCGSGAGPNISATSGVGKSANADNFWKRVDAERGE